MTTTLVKQKLHHGEWELTYRSFDDLPLYDERYISRWKIVTETYYRLPGEQEIFKTQTRDLTYAGASIFISPDVLLNQKISLKVNLSPTKSFEAIGTILWKCTRENECYAGVIFDHLPQKTEELILDFAFAVPS